MDRAHYDQMAAEIHHNTTKHTIPGLRAIAADCADLIQQELPDLTSEQLGVVVLLLSQLIGKMTVEIKNFNSPVAVANILALLGAGLYTGQPISDDPSPGRAREVDARHDNQGA